eukprot:scaffold71645_cov75-Attheya_sp.AAC.2
MEWHVQRASPSGLMAIGSFEVIVPHFSLHHRMWRAAWTGHSSGLDDVITLGDVGTVGAAKMKSSLQKAWALPFEQQQLPVLWLLMDVVAILGNRGE